MTSKPTATGVLVFDPVSDGVRSKPWYAIVRCDEGWFRLYEHWMSFNGPTRWAKVTDDARVFGGQFVDRTPRLALVREGFQRPAWGPHITVVRGEQPMGQGRNLWGTAYPRPLVFTFDPELRTNGKHWWINIECPEILDIRYKLGLRPEPRVRLHLTVGVVPGADND
jgi:hypothetical protein